MQWLGWVPTAVVTNAPTIATTGTPTISPTKAPTNVPTKVPTKQPTTAPTDAPTAAVGGSTVDFRVLLDAILDVDSPFVLGFSLKARVTHAWLLVEAWTLWFSISLVPCLGLEARVTHAWL